ncbi:MAG: hypothetical protein ACI8RD_007965 [Bacillariaceae sp.]|jgi:hypothetical protein
MVSLKFLVCIPVQVNLLVERRYEERRYRREFIQFRVSLRTQKEKTMSDDIPYAHPFPWGDSTIVERQRSTTRSLRKRKFVGSGLAVLRRDMGSESKIGNLSKNILMNLFHQHGIEVDGELESDANKFKGLGLSKGSLHMQTHTSSTDDNPLKLQAENRSFFVPLLKVVIESVDSPISTRHILKKICLLLQPGTLPGNMDSKDMVLAALHFLSSKSETKSDNLLRLPLIRSEKAYGDLERRNFVKVGDWKLEDIEEKLLKMEELFLSSPSSWKWLKRDSFSLSLRLSKADEEAFFMKGTVPLSVKGEGVRKRRVAVQKKETNSPAEAVEASIDEAAINDDEPVVEAIILDEVS